MRVWGLVLGKKILEVKSSTASETSLCKIGHKLLSSCIFILRRKNCIPSKFQSNADDVEESGKRHAGLDCTPLEIVALPLYCPVMVRQSLRKTISRQYTDVYVVNHGTMTDASL